MDTVAITIGISWTLAGLLCLGLSIPLIRGHTGRNHLYGVRFPQSFESEEAWLSINRYGGRQLAICSIPLITIGVVSFFLPLQSQPVLTLLLGFGPLAFLLIPLFQSWRFARRYRPEA